MKIVTETNIKIVILFLGWGLTLLAFYANNIHYYWESIFSPLSIGLAFLLEK